jgi:hypothetical protein
MSAVVTPNDQGSFHRRDWRSNVLLPPGLADIGDDEPLYGTLYGVAPYGSRTTLLGGVPGIVPDVGGGTRGRRTAWTATPQPFTRSVPSR